jgi:hypothetical protein
MNPHFTPSDIEDRFEEAVRTLSRLPSTRPAGYVSAMPDYVRSRAELQAATPSPMRLLATPQAITRMDQCFEWLRLLEPDDARIVWARAEGQRWRPICHRLGISRMTAWRKWAAAMITIAAYASDPGLKAQSEPAKTAPITPLKVPVAPKDAAKRRDVPQDRVPTSSKVE